jgi:prefoldin subunit 5
MFKKDKEVNPVLIQIDALNKTLESLFQENLELKSKIVELEKTIELMKVMRNENAN